jgi:hypothetical protein
MKKFFNITENYKFDIGDLRAFTMVLNVILIMTIGLSSSWFGLTLAVLGLVRDFYDPNRRINGMVNHLASAVLNIYFLVLFYTGA